MSKITKNQRINQIADQLARKQGVISKLTIAVKEQNEAILMLEKLTDEKLRDQPEPQLKQLDQSIFNGLHEKWRFAVIQNNGFALICTKLPFIAFGGSSWDWNGYSDVVGKGYDASNWQNSLIERDTAKELAEVDLSSELTGSELCKAMLARGDKYVSGFGHHHSDRLALESKFADTVSKHTQCFQSSQNAWDYFVPINNQGEPLTASEVGL